MLVMMPWDILFDHHTWATRTVLAACDSLSPKQLDRSFQMGPGSVRRTLLHMASAQMWWTDRLLERERIDYPGETHCTANMQQIAMLHDSTDAEFRRVAEEFIES